MNVTIEIEAEKWSMRQRGGYNFANYIDAFEVGMLLKQGSKQKHRS